MTPAEFRDQRLALGQTIDQRAADLGLSRRQVIHLEAGERRDVTDEAGAPRPVPISRLVALACAAIAAGLEPL